MRKVWAVIRREFIERVRTRWFIVSTVLGPVFMTGVVVLPALVDGGGDDRRIVIADLGAGEFGDRLAGQFDSLGGWLVTSADVPPGRVEAVLDSVGGLVRGGVLDGFLVIDATTVDSGRIEYRGRNAASPSAMRELRVVLRQAVLRERLGRAGVDPILVAEAARDLELNTVQVSKKGSRQASGEATFWLGYAVVFILYLALIIYGQSVLRSVVSDKTTRIVEVLASSMRPTELMAGKVIGVGSVGLFQLGIWGLAGAALYGIREPLSQRLGVDDLASVSFPTVSLGTAAVVLLYFVLGYFLYAALYAAVGAMVTTEQEAQQAQMPVTLLLVVGIILFPPVMNDPVSGLARALTLIPFTAPIIMPLRWIVTPLPLLELAASLGSLAVGTALLVWVSARIYRVGILMYGKRASLSEVMRWVRSV